MKFSTLPNLLLSSVIFLFGAVISKNSNAQIFAYVDPDGKLVISDKQVDERYRIFDPRNPQAFKRSSSRTGKLAGSAIVGLEQRYTTIIESVAREVGVSAHLLHAVIQVESAYNPQALSSKGAQGLMQLIPVTAARFGVDEVHDPESNIRGGARYLKNLMGRFNNDMQLTLAAYNAGEGTVQKYKNTIPPYPETQAYISRVLEIFQERILRERNSS